MSIRKYKFFRNIWYAIPVKARYPIRQIYYFPIDLKDKLTGKSQKYVPPRGLIFTGSSVSSEKYLKEARHQLDLLKQIAGLQQDDAVLDVGSGLGRTAIALSGFLSENARYEGFDVVEKGVNWCQNGIGKDFPNFNFTYVPLFNDLYNQSANSAEEFRFPYENQIFDVTFSFSVFTHMRLPEIEHYLHEIFRVLKPNGKSLNTFFLYDDSNAEEIANREGFGFPIDKGNYKLMNEKVQGANIAIHIDEIHAMAKRAGLKVEKIMDGFWVTGKKSIDHPEYQDVVVFTKKD